MSPDESTATEIPGLGLAEQVVALQHEVTSLTGERDRYKQLAELLQKELERLRDGQKTPRESVDAELAQLAFSEMLRELLAKTPAPEEGSPTPPAPPPPTQPEGKTRKHTPHGRGILPENLPVETVVLEPEGATVEGAVLNEEVSWRLAFRRGGFYRLKLVRPVFVVPQSTAADAAAVTATEHDGNVSRLMPTEQAGMDHEPPSATAESVAVASGTVEASAASGQDEHPGLGEHAVTKPADAIAATATPEAAGERVPAASTEPKIMAPVPGAARARDRATTIICAPAPDEMIPRGLPTIDLLAHILVAKFADKLPFRRQEGIYARQGVSISAATMCGWAEKCHELARHIVDAMHKDAVLFAHFIGTDSTGVLVQANARCKRGHFWVLVADHDHALFRYSRRCSSEEPLQYLRGFGGIVIADALAVYDALFGLPDGPSEGGCNAHARRYFYKALLSDRERALIGIGYFNELFRIERQTKKLSPGERLRVRQERAKPLVEQFERWRAAELANPEVAEGTPIRRALNYTANHWQALCRFLNDGKIPIHNNRSELELRRLVIGRANWLFVGSDDTAPWTCTFVSLIASCALHGLDPEQYLRDVFRVLPTWPLHRALELAPKFWAATRARLNPRELALPLGPIAIPPGSVPLPVPGQAAE